MKPKKQQRMFYDKIHDYLPDLQLLEEPERSLLMLCAAFRGNGNHDTLVYRLSGILMKFNQGEKLDAPYLCNTFP